MPDPASLPEGRYVNVLTTGFAGMGVAKVCRYCGAVIHTPGPDDQSPTTVEVHDAFHEQIIELLADLRRREEWAAEEAERDG